MPSKLELAGSQAVITLEDSLTLRHADEIRKVLIKALLEAEEVAIIFRNVTDLDLSCLQLLCSAHRSAARVHKRLTLVGSTPPLIRRSMEAAGYSQLAGLPVQTSRDERRTRTAPGGSGRDREQWIPGETDHG